MDGTKLETSNVGEPLVKSIPFEDVAGKVAENYKPRLPLPSSCLDRIDAAFYFYDRKSGDDMIYLMSHGYVWV